MNRADKAAVTPARVLLSPRWIFGHLLALVLIIAFIAFGFWQLDRLGQVRADNQVRTEREALPPVLIGQGQESAGLDSLLADAELGTDLDLRHATVTGVYEPADELLLRSRSLNGQPGWHVLTPLRLEDGSALLVDRGWVPYDHDSPPVGEAAPPAGTVTLDGVLRASERPPEGFVASFAPRNPAGEGHLEATWYIDLERLGASQIPELLPGAWLLLQDQQPAQTAELPVAGSLPEMDEGPHFGYAFQWFSFAGVGIIGYIFLMRKVIRDTKAG